MRVERGTIHGIVGENGAGKSTLMSILYGFYEADSGEIRVNGKPIAIRSPNDAIHAGIGMVHQHFMLVEPLSVVENVMLGAEGGAMLRVGEAKARAELARLAKDYGLEIDADATVGDLSVGLQQRVEILKALYRGADILILDEPTAVLTPPEADALFELLRSLKEQGKTVILITHKLREIMAITDRVSVMRRGEMVATARDGRHLAAGTGGADGRAARAAARREGREDARRAAARGREPLRRRCARRAAGGQCLLHRSCGRDRRHRRRRRQRPERIAGSDRRHAPAHARLDPPRGAGHIRPREHNPHRMRQLGLLHVPEDRLRMGLVPAFPAFESAILGFSDEPQLGRGPDPRP